MKIKILAVIFLLMSCAISGISQSFNSISKQISKYEFSSGLRKEKKDDFFEIRKRLNSLDKVSFITKSDTLFLLESFSVENGNYYGLIWNTLEKVGYIYNNKTFDFGVNEIFTNYTCKLVQTWDTNSIRQEERINSTMINPRNIYATRVIKNKGVLKIDCIMFKEFFLIDRDR